MRDLEKDLAICEAATPGPWLCDERVGCVAVYPGKRVNCIDEAREKMVHYQSGYQVKTENGEFDHWDVDPQKLADARLIAESREGWPEAIKRAQAAEAEVERLRPIYEAYREWLRLKEESKTCLDCLERRARGFGWGCRKHEEALLQADCDHHNAVIAMRRYEEAQAKAGDPA